MAVCPACHVPTPQETLQKLGGLCMKCLSTFVIEGESSGGEESATPASRAPSMDFLPEAPQNTTRTIENGTAVSSSPGPCTSFPPDLRPR